MHPLLKCPLHGTTQLVMSYPNMVLRGQHNNVMCTYAFLIHSGVYVHVINRTIVHITSTYALPSDNYYIMLNPP